MAAVTIPPPVLRRSGSLRNRIRLLILCGMSFMAHGLFLYVTSLGPMHLGKPVAAGDILVVDLQRVSLDSSGPETSKSAVPLVKPVATSIPEADPATPEVTNDDSPVVREKGVAQPSVQSAEPAVKAQVEQKAFQKVHTGIADSSPEIGYARVVNLPPPIRRPGEFIGSVREKLVYSVRMFGVPVGEASLEASTVNGELHIVSHVKSSAATSLVYPVDNTTETRMFNGRYIMTTIKRREEGIRTDIGYTLCLGEKKVFWADRVNNLYLDQPLPDERVLDLVTGFYYLRSQPLSVGSTLALSIFDSNTYAATPVHVLRKEHLILPGFREADTLVVWPELKTEGPFMRTGELLVWLTDDQYRVPVRLETSIALGKVTAELVSAETE